MLTLFFISSGLFLGWFLGANEVANIFGTAVSSNMVKFRKAAIIASIFVIFGATMQGTGTTRTLSQLGIIDSLGGAFTVAFCAAVIVAILTIKKIPVSTSQAIVGGIMGWCFFTSTPVDYSVLGIIVGSWISGPILGGIFSALLYILMRKFIKQSKIHVIKLDGYLRNALLIVGAFASYSLGANNIANVMGVFVNSFSFSITAGQLTFHSMAILFFIGGVAIAIGIITYGKKIMKTIGEGILEISPETAIVVVLSQALVLFIFSSLTLSIFFVRIGLPPIPLVPVSSTQVIIGSIMGIGIVKGVQEIRFSQIKNIIMSWVLTPILACGVTFFSLFFMTNVFHIAVSQKGNAEIHNLKVDKIPSVIQLPGNTGLVLVGISIVIALYFFLSAQLFYKKTVLKETSRNGKWMEQLQYAELQKSLSEIEVRNIRIENKSLIDRLDEEKKQLVTYALSISEQKKFLESIEQILSQSIHEVDIIQKNEKLKDLHRTIKQKMSFSDEIQQIYNEAEKVNDEFPSRLTHTSPQLSSQEKKLALLLRVGFSSKEIAPLLNISPKSVEIARYRLRKKLELKKDENLINYIKSI